MIFLPKSALSLLIDLLESGLCSADKVSLIRSVIWVHRPYGLVK